VFAIVLTVSEERAVRLACRPTLIALLSYANWVRPQFMHFIIMRRIMTKSVTFAQLAEQPFIGTYRQCRIKLGSLAGALPESIC